MRARRCVQRHMVTDGVTHLLFKQDERRRVKPVTAVHKAKLGTLAHAKKCRCQIVVRLKAWKGTKH